MHFSFHLNPVCFHFHLDIGFCFKQDLFAQLATSIATSEQLQDPIELPQSELEDWSVFEPFWRFWFRLLRFPIMRFFILVVVSSAMIILNFCCVTYPFFVCLSISSWRSVDEVRDFSWVSLIPAIEIVLV